MRHLRSNDDKREVGACIFALGKARISLFNCTLSSFSGFGLWLVQSAKMSATGCFISNCGRSGVVLFGSASAVLRECKITRATMHGICARGRAQSHLINLVFAGCGVRGCYAYHNSTLTLENVTISGIIDPSTAAVHVEALRCDDIAYLTMSGCVFSDNAGDDILVLGNVVKRTQ